MRPFTRADFLRHVNYDPRTGEFTRVLPDGTRLPALTSNSGGHIQIKIGGRLIFASRLAWFLTYHEWPRKLRHRNGDIRDNRVANLMEAKRFNVNLRTRAVIQTRPDRKMPGASPNKSGFKYIYQCTRTGLWFAKLTRKGKQITSPKVNTIPEARTMLAALLSANPQE